MNNSKIVLTKKIISAVFLVAVLIAGTITALSYPSFMIDAQAQSYYDGIDSRYNNYGSDYGMENNYKSQYPSYVKDDRDKSKDNKKSISINKIKCINDNININGENTGDVNIGNKKGQGNLGANSFGGYGGEGYYNGHNNNKQNKGFDCIINNNNTNTNVITGAAGDGNITDGNGNVIDICEDCFSILSEIQLEDLFPIVEFPPSQGSPQGLILETLEGLCNLLEDLTRDQDKERLYIILSNALRSTSTITLEETTTILDCLIELGLIIEPIRP